MLMGTQLGSFSSPTASALYLPGTQVFCQVSCPAFHVFPTFYCYFLLSDQIPSLCTTAPPCLPVCMSGLTSPPDSLPFQQSSCFSLLSFTISCFQNSPTSRPTHYNLIPGCIKASSPLFQTQPSLASPALLWGENLSQPHISSTVTSGLCGTFPCRKAI